MSSQSAVPLLFEHGAGDVVRPLPVWLYSKDKRFLSRWLSKDVDWLFFQREEKSWYYLTNIATLKRGCRESGEEILPLRSPFCLVVKLFGLSFYSYFLPSSHKWLKPPSANQGAGAAQPPSAISFPRNPLHSDPEVRFSLLCSLDGDADASSPTFWERSHYSVPAKNHRRTRMLAHTTYTHMHTHARVGKKSAAL